MTSNIFAKRRFALLGLVLFLWGAAPALAQERPRLAGAEAVLVPESEPWLLAIAAPALGALEGEGRRRPILVAVPERPNANLLALLARWSPRRVVALSRGGPGAATGVAEDKLIALPLSGGPFALSLAWARRVWGKSERAVLARFEDPEALIYGSALAAREGLPLLAVPGRGARVLEGLKALGVAEALIVSGRRRALTLESWGGRRVDLRPKEVQARIIRALGAERVRALVLSRSPEPEGAGRLAWLLPAWSLARGAVPILVRSADPRAAEAAVDKLIARHRLAPRTLCIVASHHSVGLRRKTIEVTEPLDQEGFVFEVEPCAEPRRSGRALSLGVGRVPLDSLFEASVLFARGLAREQEAAEPRALMMANALPRDSEESAWQPSMKGLPLCELAAHLTVAELENRGVKVDSFARISSAAPEVVAAAQRSQLLVYQGHVGDQLILEDRAFLVAETLARVPPRRRRRRDVVPELARPEVGPPVSPARLEGRPVVVLQSCRSLERRLGARIFRLGGVGLIGSVTFIHSASGSAFIDALIDAALSRGATLGEALRDARNDFFLLQDLKDRRGHKEQAKSLRVALSFRLWGDPELRLFAGALAAERLPSPQARWGESEQLEMRFPAERFPELVNEAYHARFFPGSRSAGLVRREDKRVTRALAPLYSFRLALPEALADRRLTALRGGGKNRVVFRVDALGRSVVVLYFPKEAEPGSTRTLTFKVRERRKKAAAKDDPAPPGE